MQPLDVAQMRAIQGGLSTECGVVVGAAVASWFFFPLATMYLVEAAAAVCATT
ncbi:MAG TPA: hypothetical protein VEM13_05270 [Gemmatimonadales bacterium]|nr:hypothetical protein [Gemmatimonadales bacterium]